MMVVKPATVVQWHRKGFRIYWRWRSRRPRRPKMSTEFRDLIRQMSLANPLWGAPRIHGELLKLGIAVSQATVGRYLPRRPKAPSSARSAGNVWITSSSSMSVTCGTSCRAIFNIITERGPICHSTRIVRSIASYSLPLRARLSPSRRWAVCIIATSVAPPDLRGQRTNAGPGVKDRCIFHPLCSHATVPGISIHFVPVADVRDAETAP
jgi:hypothetical protein